MEIMDFTAVKLGEKIKNGEIGVREALDAALERIEKQDGLLHAFITVDREKAVRTAEKIQEEIRSKKELSPLAGVPAAVKDNICIKGMKTTCASKMLGNFIPAYTAEAVSNLEQAGALILGKTNMDEFAMGSTTETSAFGPTRNPWDTDRVPGGSSGGSCAAVSSGECSFALGSDTGGSIRQPSSYCGVCGIKPTYGTVSRYGLIAYGSSLDQIGPVAKTVEDCAAILDVISSHDAKDSTSMEREYGFYNSLSDDIRGMKIGLPRDYFTEGLDPDVKKNILDAVYVLREKGASVEEFDLGYVKYAIPAYYTIADAEASSNLERFDGIKYGYRAKEYEGLHQLYKKSRSEGFGEEVKRRILLGSFVLSSGYYDAYYLKALKVKALIKKAWDDAFEKFDVVVAPAAPTAAPKLGESLADPMKMYLSDIYTVSVNLAGLPGLSVPCGKDRNGLPVGIQFIGNCFEEKKILRAGYVFQKEHPYEGVKGGSCHAATGKLQPEGQGVKGGSCHGKIL